MWNSPEKWNTTHWPHLPLGDSRGAQQQSGCICTFSKALRKIPLCFRHIHVHIHDTSGTPGSTTFCTDHDSTYCHLPSPWRATPYTAALPFSPTEEAPLDCFLPKSKKLYLDLFPSPKVQDTALVTTLLLLHDVWPRCWYVTLRHFSVEKS